MNAAAIILWIALLFSTVMLLITACSTTARDQAVTGCRQAGYLGAVEDAGLWYCFRDRLGLPPVVPATPK